MEQWLGAVQDLLPAPSFLLPLELRLSDLRRQQRFRASVLHSPLCPAADLPLSQIPGIWESLDAYSLYCLCTMSWLQLDSRLTLMLTCELSANSLTEMEKMGDGSGFSVAVKRGATAFVGT
ncbi:unnamed protein product [Thlaspi arvense]|uniref:Uncharacterized protein n=1 Tax=Thlaspi arvense TaxID=13288 RepID=A0AAU9T4R1_THLAR|nr:unnamed protein product [Thlaspi arvense]